MNQSAARDYIRVRSLDTKSGTMYSYAHILWRLDDHLNGLTA